MTFVSMYTNCAVWSIYGILMNNMTVLAPNITGLALGFYFTSVYAKYYQGSMMKEYLISGGLIGGSLGAALMMETS